MAFVKLDTGILDSTLWVQRDPREVFITALLMALPREFRAPMKTLKVSSLEEDNFVIPPGWYGVVEASGPGIVRRAGVPYDVGMEALHQLANPEPESRSQDFEGRRMVRVDGGYVVLNFMKYRDKDNTTAERSARYRERQKSLRATVVTRDITRVTRDSSLAEAEAEAERKNTRAKKPAACSAFALPDWIPADAWAGYEEMRKKRSKPMTERARQLQVGKLDAFRQAGQNVGAILDQSTTNGWTDLYEPKDGANVVPMGRGRLVV